MEGRDVGEDSKAATVLKAAVGVLHGMRTRDDAAAALQSLAVLATAGPPATQTGEFCFIF